MPRVAELWRRIPAVVRAVVTALAVLLLGTIPPGILVQANLRVGTAAPWSLALVAVYLWVFWRYVGGTWWPRGTAQARKAWLRAGSCTLPVWAWALAAGALGVGFTLALTAAYQRLVPFPRMPFPDLSRAPDATVAGVLVLTAVTAGVVEEAAFRGYLQLPLELRWGPTLAIAATAVLFALAHLGNGAFAASRLPFYLSFGVFLGAIAFLARSILPAIVVHAVYDAQKLFRIWLFGMPEARTPIAESGVDAAFVLHGTLAVMLGALTIWALFRLRSAAGPVAPAPRSVAAPAA
jgi:membrane protease YdiL (CAAX protease family)